MRYLLGTPELVLLGNRRKTIGSKTFIQPEVR